MCYVHRVNDPDEKNASELILEDFLPYRLAVLSHTVSKIKY